MIAPLVLPLILFFGCSSNENSDSELMGIDVSLSVIAEGNLSNYDSDIHTVKRTEIYQSQQQLDIGMARYLPEIPALTVDPTSNQAVLLTLGIQSSIGSTLKVDGAIDHGDYVGLNVTYEASGAGCPQLGAINHPYMLLEIRTRKIIVIKEQFEFQDCVTQ